MMKLVILDRDGTINHDSDAYIKSPEEWVPIPGALGAIARLNRAGWRVAVATNQAGLARGLFSMEDLAAMHEKMHLMAAGAGADIDAVFFCPHHPDDGCACRKPEPGMLLQIGEHYGVDLHAVPMVGDSLKDMQAAVAAGCQPHLLLTGKSEPLRSSWLSGAALPKAFPPQTEVHFDLHGFVDALVGT